MRESFADGLAPGARVEHQAWGAGKVVGRTTDVAYIYFKHYDDPVPDRRVRQFKLPNPVLQPGPDQPDDMLDNLPPWSDGRFQQFPTSLTLETAKRCFLHRFPDGFDDPDFHHHELGYKRSAHRRFTEDFLPHCRQWIADDDDKALAQGLEAVYGDPKNSKLGDHTRLNFLYQRAEEPAYFDALEAGGPATVAFAQAAIDFIEAGNEVTFDRYVAALDKLPTRQGGARIDGWTAATWLPFIAAPDRYLVIKPTIIRSFSSSLAFDINYRPQLNFRTYRLANEMGLRLATELQHSELNMRGRPLDLIDVQSFMWAVEKYAGLGSGKD